MDSGTLYCFLTNPHILTFVDLLWLLIVSCFENKKKNSLTENIYHHHHVAPSARISLTFSRHPSLSSIASGRSSGLLYVRTGRPTFACPCEGVYWSASLMSSSLLFQQCLACLVYLLLIVFVMGGRRPYSCCFVGCYRQELFNIARSILV